MSSLSSPSYSSSFSLSFFSVYTGVDEERKSPAAAGVFFLMNIFVEDPKEVLKEAPRGLGCPTTADGPPSRENIFGFDFIKSPNI